MAVEKEHIRASAVLGLLVTFEDKNEKMMTAEVIANNVNSRSMELVTEFGTNYKVGYDQVHWVLDHGGRWPKYIYLWLKGQIDRDGNPI